MVEERTEGRIKFKFFYGSSLIKKPQFVDAVARGIADISTGPVSFVTGKIPELSIFEIYGGYKLDKYVEIQKAVWGPMKELFIPKGVYPLMFQFSGPAIFPPQNQAIKNADRLERSKNAFGRPLAIRIGQGLGMQSGFYAPERFVLGPSARCCRWLYADLGHRRRVKAP